MTTTIVDYGIGCAEQARLFILAEADEERFPRLSEIADAAGVSVSYVHLLFRQRFGQTPSDLVKALKIAMAKRLLLSGLRQTEVGRRCGKTNQSRFCVWFRHHTGQPPGQWLREQRERAVAQG